MFSTTTAARRSGTNGCKVQRRKPEVSVVKNVFREYNQEKRETAAKGLVLSRVVHLLEDPLSSTFKERHIFVLKRLVKKCQKGFLLRELVDIFKILNLCAEKVKDHPEYTSLLCDLLQICRLPFLKEKSSDEISYGSVVRESLSQLGFLMRVPSDEVRQQICSAIISFYVPAARLPDCPEGLCAVSVGYKPRLVEESGLAETLLLALALLEQQLPGKLLVLQALQMLSSASEVNCRAMLRAKGAQTICFHMNEPDTSGQVLFRSSEILWNLLEKGTREEVTSQLSNMDCILGLKEAFLHQLLNGIRHYDQQLRNDLLVITTLIAENPKAPLIESEFAKQLILYSTYPELKTHNPLLRNFKLSFSNEDFEMKRLLLNLVVVLAKDLTAVQLLREHRVLLALMTLIKPRAAQSQPSSRSWTPAQQEELQLQALATLATVAPLMLEEYVTCQGNTCLLMLLEWCTEQDAYFSRGHSFHGTGGRGGKKAQMRYCVRLLRSMVSLSNAEINQDLSDQGALGQLLGILKRFEEQMEEEDPVCLEIMTDILLILSLLCQSDLHRKDLFGAEGVELVTRLLRMSPEKIYSGLGHNRLILAVVDCVWSCIVGCYTTEDVFLEREGVYLLLDLLHSCHRNMQSVVLGTLLELCDNPKTLLHLQAWRGRQGEVSAPAMLLKLWRQEEAELGVKRDQHGRITDPKRPILSVYQEEDPVVPLPPDRPSPAVMDVTENLRAKIYSIFCKLGFEDLSGMSTEDYITLSIVSRYLDFKVGEVWDEISVELGLEGVRPVTPDKEALEAIATVTEDTARRVMDLQQSMLDQQKEEDLQQERLMYSELSSTRRQQELTARSWELHVAKTSNYEILKDWKKQQVKSIESSRPEAEAEDCVFHSTQISGLQTTTFCGGVVSVESTPAHLTGGGLAHTELALERLPIQGGAPRKVPPPPGDLELPSTVSVK